MVGGLGSSAQVIRMSEANVCQVLPIYSNLIFPEIYEDHCYEYSNCVHTLSCMNFYIKLFTE